MERKLGKRWRDRASGGFECWLKNSESFLIKSREIERDAQIREGSGDWLYFRNYREISMLKMKVRTGRRLKWTQGSLGERITKRGSIRNESEGGVRTQKDVRRWETGVKTLRIAIGDSTEQMDNWNRMAT
jgi:hypothetical protein